MDIHVINFKTWCAINAAKRFMVNRHDGLSYMRRWNVPMRLMVIAIQCERSSQS